MVPCDEHGETAWCYIQDDQSHIDSECCPCLRTYRSDCPVDEYRDRPGQRA